MTFILYISRVVGLRILAVTTCLLVLGIGIDLIKVAPDLLEFGGGHAVATYAALRVPAMLATSLPIATLIGTLLAMLSMGQSSELAIIRSAGVSTFRILFWLTPLALFLGMLHFLAVDRGVVWSTSLLGSTFGEIADIDVPELGRVVAVRDDDRVFYGRLASLDGTRLSPFTLFSLDSEGNITERTTANSANYSDGTWTLRNARRVATTTEEAKSKFVVVPELAVQSALTPELVLDLASNEKAIDSRHAAAVLAKKAIATRGSAFYAMQIAHSRIVWAIPFVMMLIGMLGSYKLPRSSTGLRAAGLGFLLGICYVGTDGLFMSLGRLGVVPTEWAAYTPIFSFSLLALVALNLSES